MSRLLLILSSSAKSPAGALHQNISNPIWRFWCLHFVHVSNHGLIYPSHPDISFSSFQVEEKVFLHFFKQNGLSVFFHTAPVLFFRKRKHIIFSFQNYDLIFFFFLIFKKIFKQSKRLFCAINFFFIFAGSKNSIMAIDEALEVINFYACLVYFYEV